jgi:hypothetical protein
MQNQALFPCFVSAMLSSVTTELAVAAFCDPWAAFLLGLLQVVLASLLVFLFASSLAWLHFFIERVALWLWLSF